MPRGIQGRGGRADRDGLAGADFSGDDSDGVLFDAPAVRTTASVWPG
nr:hypothetical protein [Phytoactinopolyspora limicola]